MADISERDMDAGSNIFPAKRPIMARKRGANMGPSGNYGRKKQKCIYLSHQNDILLEKISLALGQSGSSVIEGLISDYYWENKDKIEGLLEMRPKLDRYQGRKPL